MTPFQLLEERRKIVKELSKHLSPNNQNVKDEDIIAMIRDLAQIKVTAMDNCRELEKRLRAWQKQCHAYERLVRAL